MKDKVERTVEKIGDKVYMHTVRVEDKSTDGRSIVITNVNRTEVDYDVLDEYEKDRADQYEGFKIQEDTNKSKLKSLENDYKKYSGERGYKQYKKNFQQYEIYEKFIEEGVNVDTFLSGDSLKDFNKYMKKRDLYKNFFVTMNIEVQMQMCNDNLKAFDDIWEEDEMFIQQIKQARKLLNE